MFGKSCLVKIVSRKGVHRRIRISGEVTSTAEVWEGNINQ